MKIGVLGPANDPAQFRAALTFLLDEAGAERVVFLGDGDFLDRVVETWTEELGREGEEAFLMNAHQVALGGSVADIDALLCRDDAAKLGAVRKMPPSPARAIELVDDRIILFVHDKSVLDEEDIANASVIVYGLSEQSLVKKFGKRVFASPGPLEKRHTLLIEPGAEGLTLVIHDADGKAIVTETVSGTQGKLTVA